MQADNENNHIFGILYQHKEDGAIFLLNDDGAHRVFIEPPESLLLPATAAVVRETSTVLWNNSGEKETWDSQILEDLLHDMEEEGRDPKNEMTYENEHCSSIIISST